MGRNRNATSDKEDEERARSSAKRRKTSAATAAATKANSEATKKATAIKRAMEVEAEALPQTIPALEEPPRPPRGSAGQEAEGTEEGPDGEDPSPSSPSPSVEASSPEDPPPPSPPKFEVFQTVFARDTDGVLYEAVVRRRLHGRAQSRQVQMGLVASEQEADDLLNQEEGPSWHYFVHYNGWNANWDRWVPESGVLEPTESTRTYASRLRQEHRALRESLTRKVKGKKGFQTVEGAEFLRLWRDRMARVDAELLGNAGGSDGVGTADPAVPPPVQPRPGEKAKASAASPHQHRPAALASERRLRAQGLTAHQPNGATSPQALALPWALKKHLVDAWEIVSQCRMVPVLPAPVTVRQALDLYVQSKGSVVVRTDEGDGAEQGGPKEAADSGDGNVPDASRDDREAWRDMADGIAQLFDEALPSRLLYREEIPQYRALIHRSDCADLRDSELYGPEHLLRLLLRLPDAVEDLASDDEASSDAYRQILAKIRDLIRFLHKNQQTLFGQPYRRLDDFELKERAKLEGRRKRKRKSDDGTTSAGDTGAAASAATAAATNANCSPEVERPAAQIVAGIAES